MPPLPVLQWLPAVADDARRVAVALVEQLCVEAHSLNWRRTYTADQLGKDFVRNYGYTEIVGLHAPVPANRLACGFLLLGPRTFYPRHRHEAEEIYVPLSGTAQWQQGDLPWREHRPGTLIYHASDEPHAMQTGDQPLLGLYMWSSDNLNQKSTLDPETERR